MILYVVQLIYFIKDIIIIFDFLFNKIIATN